MIEVVPCVGLGDKGLWNAANTNTFLWYKGIVAQSVLALPLTLLDNEGLKSSLLTNVPLYYQAIKENVA